MLIATLVSAISFLITVTMVVPAFAGVSEQVNITLDNAHFISLSPGLGNQVGMFVSYTIDDSSIEDEVINAVMKVYASNGTLLKTSSYPTGFVAQNLGGKAELKTTLTDQTIKSVTANVMFTDLEKTEIISNQLTANLNLTTTPPPTTPGKIGEAGDTEEEVEEEAVGFDDPMLSAEDEDIDDAAAEDEEEEDTEESDDEEGEDDESIPEFGVGLGDAF
jgi:hypothetical protein